MRGEVGVSITRKEEEQKQCSTASNSSSTMHCKEGGERTSLVVGEEEAAGRNEHTHACQLHVQHPHASRLALEHLLKVHAGKPCTHTHTVV